MTYGDYKKIPLASDADDIASEIEKAGVRVRDFFYDHNYYFDEIRIIVKKNDDCITLGWRIDR